MKEEWKNIPSCKGYQISNLGRVRSARDRILTPSLSNSGYFLVCLFVNGKRKTAYIHRLLAEAFLERRNPEWDVVNHKNYDKMDNDLNNLEWCSSAYNINHSLNNPRRHLRDISKIRFLFKNIPDHKFEEALQKCCSVLEKFHENK